MGLHQLMLITPKVISQFCSPAAGVPMTVYTVWEYTQVYETWYTTRMHCAPRIKAMNANPQQPVVGVGFDPTIINEKNTIYHLRSGHPDHCATAVVFHTNSHGAVIVIAPWYSLAIYLTDSAICGIQSILDFTFSSHGICVSVFIFGCTRAIDFQRTVYYQSTVARVHPNINTDTHIALGLPSFLRGAAVV